jgi:hypothetical protein
LEAIAYDDEDVECYLVAMMRMLSATMYNGDDEDVECDYV